MKRGFQFLLLLVLVLIGCTSNSTEKDPIKVQKDPVLTEIGGENYLDYVRVKVDVNGDIDTTQIGSILFEEPTFDFGDIELGSVKTHTFTFKSMGPKPLVIISAESSCGCTVPSFDKKPILPGNTGIINIKFDTNNRSVGQTEKTVIVKSNTLPNIHKLKIKANVIE